VADRKPLREHVSLSGTMGCSCLVGSTALVFLEIVNSDFFTGCLPYLRIDTIVKKKRFTVLCYRYNGRGSVLFVAHYQ